MGAIPDRLARPVKAMIGGLLAILAAQPAMAAKMEMHGALKNETAAFISGETRLDKMQFQLDLEPEVVLTGRWQFRGRSLAWYDASTDINPTNSTDLTGDIKRHYRTYLRSKEAYLLYTGDSFDLRLGQQQIVWGKTDGLRMLDIVNPLDMREFILDDFLDSRIGLWSARLNYYTYIGGKEHELELIVIPDARPAEFAPLGSRWAFALPVPAGLTPVILPGNKPNWSAKNTEYGVAWRSNLSGWDLSLNWFYGWKDTPNFEKSLAGLTILMRPAWLRMHTMGGSFSNAFGPWVVRGELAVNLKEGIDINRFTPANSVERHTTLNGAVAVEYTKDNWVYGGQLFFRHVTGWHSPIAEDRLSGFASLRIATDFMNERLKPEVIALVDWADGSWLVRPKMNYEFTDRFTGTAGADLFYGTGGLFGQFADNDRVYIEAKYSF